MDLGIIQMNADGRPDGEHPFGYPSLLEFYESQAEHDTNDDRESETSGPTARPDNRFLTTEDVQAIQDEALQYYHRYIALLALEDYGRVVRDTTRNLRVLDLVRDYAVQEDDRAKLEQFRPYITMIRARALASHALKDNEPKAALLAIDEGLEALKAYFAERGMPQMFEQSNEVQMLRGMRESLVPRLPVSQKAELKQRLTDAVKAENYELAAILRDELKNLKE